MNTLTLTVEGMTCGHCKAAIEEEVGALRGVATVTADVEKGRVDVTGDVDEHKVRSTIEEVGYRVA